MAKNTGEKAFRVSITDLDTGKVTTLTAYTSIFSMTDRRVARDVQVALGRAGYRTTDVDDRRHKRR